MQKKMIQDELQRRFEKKLKKVQYLPIQHYEIEFLTVTLFAMHRQLNRRWVGRSE